MPRTPSKTPTDWETRLLHVLWKEGPSNVDAVREALRAQGEKRSDSAIRTLLKIMVRKGFVTVEPGEYAAIYNPTVTCAEVEGIFFRHLTETLFDGDKKEFLTSLCRHALDNGYTAKQLESLLKKLKTE